ncbi:transcriptional regulator, IclR family [Tranquillimonas alkanivorans]|uniref:Transcriptional regulator, IclR family n=1 Tax=Tranquillimonas alkanivorans TaxID=441119 RepID=A0A1I5UIK1_9RHOB|nr:transcriptional regulator, IclR family [Tranquillimonas alkanivorans]
MPMNRRANVTGDSGMPAKNQRRIRSLETGGAILEAMAAARGPVKLRDLAEAVSVAPAQLHPYLVSLRAIRLVEQTEAGLYRLGPFALELGLSRLREQDAYNEAIARVGQLAEETRMMVALSVWGLHGVTIVHVKEGPSQIHANVRVGGGFMMTATATGRLFAAFYPNAKTEAAIERECRESAGAPGLSIDMVRYRSQVEEVRRRGFETTVDAPVPGVSAAAAPVFDYSGTMQLGVTVMGPTPLIDLRQDGPIISALLRFTEGLSRDLGYGAQSSDPAQ